MNETDFLQRIRERLITNQPSSRPDRFPRPVRTLPDDLANEFSQRLTAVGGHAYLVKDAPSARQQIHDIIDSLRQKGIPLHRAVATNHAILHEMELDTLLPHLDVETFPIPHTTFRISDADLGVTGVEYAVASSGTLVVAASPQHPRSASLLPLVHIAVVGHSQLLPDLAALADKLHQDYSERPSSGVALITGPSRTADIEQTLSIGVHGPGELHVLMIDD